jgi:hypothetical protein
MRDRMTGKLRFVLLAALALLSLGVAGCHKKSHQTEGATEGIYVDAGPLTYQVQISRQLNPQDIEDRNYLAGLTPAEKKLNPDEAWFAVFMRVQNLTKDEQQPTHRYRIVDTQDKVYTPLTLPHANVFAYRPPPEMQAQEVYPDPDQPAGSGPIQGSLLLFKVKIDSLANRPLELKITSPLPPPMDETATVKLDV